MSYSSKQPVNVVRARGLESGFMFQVFSQKLISSPSLLANIRIALFAHTNQKTGIRKIPVSKCQQIFIWSDLVCRFIQATSAASTSPQLAVPVRKNHTPPAAPTPPIIKSSLLAISNRNTSLKGSSQAFLPTVKMPDESDDLNAKHPCRLLRRQSNEPDPHGLDCFPVRDIVEC
jgi:hypothetical protein